MSDEKKAREFWLHAHEANPDNYTMVYDKDYGGLHVIEYSAYEKILKDYCALRAKEINGTLRTYDGVVPKLEEENYQLKQQLKEKDAEIDRLKSTEQMKWEENHQLDALKESGLEKEFGHHGCDIIQWVCYSLVYARKENQKLRELMKEMGDKSGNLLNNYEKDIQNEHNNPTVGWKYINELRDVLKKYQDFMKEK